MISFLKEFLNESWKVILKFPWWVWVGLIIVLLFLWQSLSGWSYSNKLWNMVKNEIVTDEARIIEDLEKDNLANQKEKEGLYRQLNDLKQQRVALKQEKETLIAENERLNHALENIIIPSDPNTLVDLLHKLGLRSVERRKR